MLSGAHRERFESGRYGDSGMSGYKPIEARYALLANDLMDAWEELRDEGLNNPGLFEPWIEPELYVGSWKTLGIMWQHALMENNAPWCKKATEIVLKHKDIIRNAGFSLLEAGTAIRPHVGYSGDVLRLHVGLQVPSNDCYLLVNGERKLWEDGKAFLFDDTVRHCAANFSTKPRLIFLCDVEKVT